VCGPPSGIDGGGKLKRRETSAPAVKLMPKLLKNKGFPPRVVVTDKLRSFNFSILSRFEVGPRLGAETQ
jgi:hypothetical protein